jgi:biopolymer transport protein ExbD
LDALFYVNVGALALFFAVFGSRFVLAPGLAVDFTLPAASSPGTSTRITDFVIAVPASNMAVVEGAVLDFQALGVWLRERGGDGGQPRRLLVQASASLPARDLVALYAMAANAGFEGVLIATDRDSK